MFSKVNIVSFILSLLLVVGCGTEVSQRATSWGQTKVYDDFLWKKHVPDTLTKTIYFNFNEDSKNHMNTPLVLGVFKKGTNGEFIPVLENEISLFVDNRPLYGNAIEVYPTDEKLKVSVVFTKEAENKVHYWYLRVIDDGGLDRINDSSPAYFNDSSCALMEITAEKKKVSNPLAKGFVAGGIVILGLLLLWFIILKPLLYPTFRLGNISIQNKDFSNVIRSKGFYRVVLTASRSQARQSAYSKLFVGKIKFLIDPRWTSDVIFYPRDKSSVRVHPGADFRIDSRILKKNQEYIIENITTKEKSVIKIF